MAELSAEAKAEIQAAIGILKSDGVHIHKTYPGFLKAQQDAADGKKDGPTDGKPPPVKDKPESDYEEVAGLWGVRRVKKAPSDGSPAT
jgi:hypothetical protein